MKGREVRVFISSTFQDMRQEREVLVKHVVPQLREVCERRRVSFAEVDLRWGVTDEQKARGLALSVCLAEIRDCRPFFIGILGERYGWVPASLDPPTLEEDTRSHISRYCMACSTIRIWRNTHSSTSATRAM
jgi:hypothetical protein